MRTYFLKETSDAVKEENRQNKGEEDVSPLTSEQKDIMRSKLKQVNPEKHRSFDNGSPNDVRTAATAANPNNKSKYLKFE